MRIGACLCRAIGQHALKHERIHAVVDRHQQDQQCVGEALADDPLVEFRVPIQPRTAAKPRYHEECYDGRNAISDRLRPHEPFYPERGIARSSPQHPNAHCDQQYPIQHAQHTVLCVALHASNIAAQVEDGGGQCLVEDEHTQHCQLRGTVAQEQTRDQRYDRVCHNEQQPDAEHTAEPFLQSTFILRNVACVGVGDAQIEHDVEQEAEAEQRSVTAVHLHSHPFLHLGIDAQYVERLHQQVEHQHQREVGEEGAAHGAKMRLRPEGPFFAPCA